MELRWYQQEAVQAVYRFLRERDGNPCVACPVGSGKSWILAQIARDAVLKWNGRVLVLAHVKELLEQNAEKIRRLFPEVSIGVYSAGLKRRDTDEPVIVAGIQSVYKRACELDAFDLVIVDEAHTIPPDGEGRYRQFLAEAKVVNPHLRVIGLTATPFRLNSGMICAPENILNEICYEIGLRELICQGYLAPLVSKAAVHKVDTSRLPVRAGEFVAEEAERLMDQEGLVEAACAEIIEYTRDRQACLVFSAGVAHGRHIARVLQEKRQVECGFVSAATPAREREELLARFRAEPGGGLWKEKPLKYVVNCAILTTGVDIPRLDAIAILRPTMSPGLLVQMTGRGTRLHPGKRDCLVLDFGGNIERHGPIDQIRAPNGAPQGAGGQAPAKECPECHLLIAAGYGVCPECGYDFPPPERRNHEAQASTAGVLSGQVVDTEYRVLDVLYHVHTKRGADENAPKTMRVDYKVGFYQWKSEWVCFEHTGYARWKAEKWWQARSHDPVPATAQQAVDLASCGALAHTKQIVVRTVAGEEFDRIVDYELGEKPEPVPLDGALGYSSEDLPF